MAGDIEKDKTKAELEDLGRLVDRYAQSRALPLLIPLAIMVINVILLLSASKLASLLIFHLQISMFWFTVIIIGIIVWVLLSSTWVAGKLLVRYGGCFYKKEGTIELQRERVPIWAWIAYLITFCGPAVLSASGILPVRLALTMALASFGIFIPYIGKKHKEKALGVVYGGLSLAGAALTAVGVHIPFATEEWQYSYFIALMIYLVGGGLITAMVVHIYNRKILRKIREMRPFGEQHTNRSDT